MGKAIRFSAFPAVPLTGKWFDQTLVSCFFLSSKAADLIDQTLKLASFGLDFWTTLTTVFWSTSFAEDFGTASRWKTFLYPYLAEISSTQGVFFVVLLTLQRKTDKQKHHRRHGRT